MSDITQGVPEPVIVAVRGYVERGERPGPFVCAVLANDLFEATGVVGPVNRTLIPEIARYVFNACPGRARGSSIAVEHWIGHRGLAGEPK